MHPSNQESGTSCGIEVKLEHPDAPLYSTNESANLKITKIEDYKNSEEEMVKQLNQEADVDEPNGNLKEADGPKISAGEGQAGAQDGSFASNIAPSSQQNQEDISEKDQDAVENESGELFDIEHSYIDFRTIILGKKID